MSVYIIYAREDHVVAHAVATQLAERGISVWFDHRQHSEGSGLRARLEKKMREARLVVFVMTPASAESVYCGDELQHAEKLDKQIVAAIPAPLPQEFKAPSAAIAENLFFYDDASLPGSGFEASMRRLVAIHMSASGAPDLEPRNPRIDAVGAIRNFAKVFEGVHLYRRLPLVLTILLSTALLFHVIFQPPSLTLVLLLSLAIIAATAWRFWREAKRERVPIGTVWARSRVAWASLALLIPVSVGYTLHRQSHDGPARVLVQLGAPVSAVAAGQSADGRQLVAVATFAGELRMGDPDDTSSLLAVQIPDGADRPVTQLLVRPGVYRDVQGARVFVNSPAVIAVRREEILTWTGEAEPRTIWTGEGVPLVALDEGQRLIVVETRPLRRGEARYEALSRVWAQNESSNGISFDTAMSLTGRINNFTFAISLVDAQASAIAAAHFQQAPTLPTALAVSGQGLEVQLAIGGSEGELVACAQRGNNVATTTPQGTYPEGLYFACSNPVASGTSSPITAITLDGNAATTRHLDGSVVAWTQSGATWSLDTEDGSPGSADEPAAPDPSSGDSLAALPGSDIKLASFRDHAPEIARLPDGRIIAGGWDGRVMIVDPEAAGAMAQADPAAWIASLWAPVGDTARTMFANIPGLGSSNMWERLSAADRAIAIDRNPRPQSEAWFAIGSVIAMPREDFTEAAIEPDATTTDGQPLPDAVLNRRRLNVDSAVEARDRLGQRLESQGLSGIVTPNPSGTITTTIGVDPTRWQSRTQPEQQQNDPDQQANDPDTYAPPQGINPPAPRQGTTPTLRQTPSTGSRLPGATAAAPRPATPPAIPPRTRSLGSADIRSLFAAEAEVGCLADYTPAQLQADPAVATACIVQQLRQSGDYQYAEFDYIARPAQAAPALGVSSAMRDQWAYGAGPGGSNLFNLRWSEPAASNSASANGVVVALIDTGLALDHPAVNGAAWLAAGYDMVSDPLMANDSDGRDSNPDDAGDRCNTEDPRSADSLHGTHVAGLVAAAGVANLKVVPVRALGRCGGKLSDINDAILWAAGIIPARDVEGSEVWNASPADIINLSFEFPVACPGSLQNAIDQAVATGAVVVAAAGNGGRDAALWSPGGCNNVVSVGASDARGAPAAYSNFGAGITLYAPGGDLSRDDNGDGVKDGVVSWGEGGTRCVDAITGEARTECRHVMSAGTSNAAALATAALAILKAKNPAAPNGDLVAQLAISTRESCIAHPNLRNRRACISATGGPVRVLGAAVANKSASRAGEPQQGLATTRAPGRETLVAFAASAGSYSEQGAYAPILAEELARPNTDILQVFQRTEARVLRASGGRQLPEFSSRLSRKLCLSCAATGPRVALVIAQAKYTSGSIMPLARAADEGAAMAEALRRLGFDVVFVRDQSRTNLLTQFQQLSTRVRAAGPDAVAFVYYAGHGLHYEEADYLLGTDADVGSQADIALSGVDLADLIALLGADSATSVFVIDASRSLPPIAGSR
jgi:subtilisin family serine protease